MEKLKLPRKISKEGFILKMMIGKWRWVKPLPEEQLQILFHAIETETCPGCGDPLRVTISYYLGKTEGSSYFCPGCSWESGFCTPAPERPPFHRKNN